MNSDELKKIQDPVKARYREDPKEAQVEFAVCGEVDFERLVCRIDPSSRLGRLGIPKNPAGWIESGLHPAAGGSGETGCSAEMLLASLVACAGVTLAAVSTAMSIPIRFASVESVAEMDFRGTLGVDKSVPIGLQQIRITFHVDTDASDEQLATLLKLTERYCVIMQTLKPALPIQASLLRITVGTM